MNASLQTQQQWLEALTEVVGSAEVAQLPSVWPPEALTGWLRAHYGDLAGYGVAVRVGRAMFSRLEPPTPLRLGLLPHRERLERGLAWLAEQAAPLLNAQLHWQRGEAGWSLRLEGAHPEATCALWHGLLLETCYWFGGHLYVVEVRACRRNGDADCVFHIPRQPLR